MPTLLEILNDPDNQSILERRLEEEVATLVLRTEAALKATLARTQTPEPSHISEPRGVPSTEWAIPANENFRWDAAAATESVSRTIKSRSLSGIWTIELLEGVSAEDRAVGRGSILLTVDPEYQATYEGLIARVFAKDRSTDQVLVLAEQEVQRGELYASFSHKGLDLRAYSTVSVEFSRAPQTPMNNPG